jgi:hypothetical protein
MTQKLDHINASEPVSTVTKHIKIYSDNPIHDCIDRMIDCCYRLDENIGDSIINYRELKNAARELNQIAHSNVHKEIQKREAQLDAKFPG